MNVLLVHAHHEPRSFCSAMRDAIIARLVESGHKTECSDLYRDRFDPVSDRRNFKTKADPIYLRQHDEEAFATAQDSFAGDIAAEMDKVLRADLLIFNFPLWWFGLPAIFKGWVDRVFAYGKMYGGDLFYENGIGRGKRALLTVTTGGPAGAYASEGLNPPIDLVLRPIHQGIFWFLGYEPIAPFVAFGPRAQSEAQLSDTLARLTRHISQIETLPRLAFPRRQDFPEVGAPDSLSRFMVELRRASGEPHQFQSAVSASREHLRLLELQGKLLFCTASEDDASKWFAWLFVRADDEAAVASLLRTLPLHSFLTCTIHRAAKAGL
jgi:NAD(P)H dehydrogenase (quinone)